MPDRFTLISPRVRQNAVEAIRNAPQGYRVTISQPNRSLDQNAKFHALCSDLAKSDLEWAGKRRSADEWKVLLVSAHAVATEQGGEVIPGLEGEFVAIRESTAKMSIGRASSLIEYAVAFCVSHEVPLNETERGGFMQTEVAA